VTAACRGFEQTRALPSHERTGILFRLADIIEKRSEEHAGILVMEGRKTRKFAANEVARAAITVQTSAEEAKRIYGEIIPLDVTGDTWGRTGYLQRFPLGPMIDRLKAEEAYRKVREAIRQGARILAGGSLEGNMFAPTVLVDATPAMRVNREEIFAPVISVTPYEDFTEAQRLANTGEYGLQVGIFTQNLNRAFLAFGEMDVGGGFCRERHTHVQGRPDALRGSKGFGPRARRPALPSRR